MRRYVRRFLKDTDAAVAMETLIITPILAWLFVASFIFFDAFRAYNTSLKATYAIADVLSRQTDTIFGSDLEGLADVFDHITRNTAGSSMRVTEISQSDDQYLIRWSYATDGRARLFNANLPEFEEQLPVMAVGDRILLVETFLPYDPFFDLGFEGIEFTNFTVTRPRFAGLVPFNDGSAPTYCPTGCDVGEGS